MRDIDNAVFMQFCYDFVVWASYILDDIEKE